MDTNEFLDIYNPYYKLNNGKVYDKDKFIFVDEKDNNYKAFIDAGNEPLSVENGYTVEQLKNDVLKFYGWHVGDVLLTLDELRRSKLEQLEQLASQFENNLNKDIYFVSSLGFKCNGDRRSFSNLVGLVNTFDIIAEGEPKQINFMDYNNNVQKLNKTQLETLIKEHSINGQHIYEQKWAYQKAIAAAQSIEALNQITFNFKMKDFKQS